MAFSLRSLAVFVSIVADDPFSTPRTLAAKTALMKSAEFLRSISTGGGYLWNYTVDLSERAGESLAPDGIIWFSDGYGTALVGSAYLQAWEATGDPYFLEACREVVVALAHCQLESGGWHYSGSFDPDLAENRDWAPDYKGVRALTANPEKKIYPLYNVMTTFDDDTTQLCVRFLINYVAATQGMSHSADDLARQTLEHALEGMLRAQYPNGAWPQRYGGDPRDPEDYPVQAAQMTDDWLREWPSDRPEEYMGYYTLNDAVMQECISTMILAWKKLGRTDCLDAAKKGGDFLILAQFPEPQPGWAQQYDYTMRPAWARSHEVPGITSYESRTAMQALLELYLLTGDEKYLAPIAPAIAWLQRSQLEPGIWSRYYEPGSNEPFYGLKTGVIVYGSGAPGYSLPQAFGIPDFIDEYEYIMAVGRDAWNADPFQRKPVADWSAVERRVDQVLAELDTEGRWLISGSLTSSTPVLDQMISTRTFYQNMTRLCNYLKEVIVWNLSADSFDRNTSAQNSASVPNLIGTRYTIVSGTWFTSASGPGYLQADSSGILIENTLQTRNADGFGFELSANILTSAGDSRTAGLVFNYQDSGNYYVLRYGVPVTADRRPFLQFIKVENGESAQLARVEAASGALSGSTYYTMKIVSSCGMFNFSLTDTGGNRILGGFVKDGTFTDGYSGFYRSGATTRFDDFFLKVTDPVPASK